MSNTTVVIPSKETASRSESDHARFELAAIVDSSHAAIISKNLQGNVTTWNRAATEIFGFTAKEMIGQPITRIIPHDLLDTENKIMERVITGEKIDNYD